MSVDKIPFNKPYMTGNELSYIERAHINGCLAGDGPFTKSCHSWLEKRTGANKALLTHSCTAALEMTAILMDLKPDDEVIMPSYTFVSTANAFALRGATPVFVDIREDTLNIDENLIEAAITKKTKAIVPVHYAGVACQMDVINDIASDNNLTVVEDAAQGVGAEFQGQSLGNIGHLGAFSFHETKNVICGEGGALLVKDERYVDAAEIIREKGTDRSRFIRGVVDKYTWQKVGSSFLPGEITAAFLMAQLEQEEAITGERLKMWHKYHSGLKFLEDKELLRRPIIPAECKHNAHMYYVLLDESIDRGFVINFLRERGIGVVFHYVPLHSSPAGSVIGRVASAKLAVTDNLASRLLRLPLWIGLTDVQIQKVIEGLFLAIKNFHRLDI